MKKKLSLVILLSEGIAKTDTKGRGGHVGGGCL